MFHNFTEMPVWQKAHQLALEVFQLTVALPRSEDYGLTSQIRRSSNSSPANIAEGFGRKTKKDKANFYIIARGTSFETQNHLINGSAVRYFDKIVTDNLFIEYSSLIHDLNKLINALGKDS